MAKSFKIADAFIDNIVKKYDRKNIFLKDGLEWLIYKFDIRKLRFENVLKNGGTQDFHKFVYNEIIYPDPTKLLLAFCNNQASAIKEIILGRVQRKYPITLGNQTTLISPKNAGALNMNLNTIKR